MAAPDFGQDLELGDGFSSHFPLASGHRNLLLALFRRLSTSPTDECSEIYAGECLDVRELFAARLDPSRLQGIARAVERTCLYDERIDSATCKATMDSPQKKLTLSVNLIPSSAAPFALVLSTDGLTVEILNGD